VVVEDCVLPRGKELLDRSDQLVAQHRVQLDGFPLEVVELALLVEDRLGDLELSDVVEQ
jgi:hypothetical protein